MKMYCRLIPIFCLTVLATVAQPLHAQAEPPLLDALGAARRQGCDGKPGLQSPWRNVSPLNATAAQVAQGARADEAARQAGYRARQLFQASFGGYRSAGAVAQAMGQRYCEALLDPRFTDIGVHQRGTSYAVVLAAPFSPPAESDTQEVARRVLALTNGARASSRRCGNEMFAPAAPLRLNETLTRAAAVHVQDMARHGYLEHRGSDGSNAADRVTRAGYRWRSVGENIASGQPSAEEVVAGWLRSPEHCANLMQSRFTEMGVAFAVNQASEGGIYWTQMFGRPW